MIKFTEQTIIRNQLLSNDKVPDLEPHSKTLIFLLQPCLLNLFLPVLPIIIRNAVSEKQIHFQTQEQVIALYFKLYVKGGWYRPAPAIQDRELS